MFHTLDAREDELVKRKVLKLVQEVKLVNCVLIDCFLHVCLLFLEGVVKICLTNHRCLMEILHIN